MVKTQIRIDDALHAQVVTAATDDRRSLNGELLWLIALGLNARTISISALNNRDA
jgi:predicted HicB family RNase H-like nuclease